MTYIAATGKIHHRTIVVSWGFVMVYGIYKYSDFSFWFQGSALPFNVLVLIVLFNTLADPGGTAGVPPQQDPILLFSHMFSPKSIHVRGWCPPTGQHPPTENPGSTTDL